MKKFISSRFVLSGVSAVFLCSVFSVGALADSSSAFRIKTSLKGQYTYNGNDDLDTLDAKSRDAEVLELKSTFYGDITDRISFATQARAVKNYGDGGSIDSDTGEAAGNKDFIELRQYWLKYRGLAGVSPLGIRVGRQRIREERSLWWNRDFDAVSLEYDATLFSGFLTLGQNQFEYRTSRNSFDEEDQGILRFLGQTSWQWRPENFLEARFAWQDDHSGINRTGYVMTSGDVDSEDSDLFWAGVRVAGDVSALDSYRFANMTYRADAIGLVGSQDTESSTPNIDETRTVTGSTQQDVSAWAVDLGVDLALSGERKPVVSLGYAYGSGDDDTSDNDDHNFRQTGLDGNTSYMAGASGSSYNYGSVLRPDLSNIHVLTAGLVVPILKDSDVSMKYHYYRLAEDATSLATSGINASLNGTDKDLGHGLDVMLNVDVSEELNIARRGFDKIGLKTTLGTFKAGEAYGSAEDEIAVRGQVDLSFRF